MEFPITYHGEITRYGRNYMKRQMVRFISKMDFDYEITLGINIPIKEQHARKMLGAWLARVDSYVFGKKWSRMGDRRTFSVASMEHLDSNAHLHVLALLPEELADLPKWKIDRILKNAWSEILSTGDFHNHPKLESRSIIYRSVNYNGKGWSKTEAYENIVFSTEFHTHSTSKTDLVNTNMNRKKKHAKSTK